MPSQALLQRGKKPYGLVMLFEQISERFSGKLSERAARLVRHGLYRLPGIIIDWTASTMHVESSSDTRTTNYIPERRSDELRLLSPLADQHRLRRVSGWLLAPESGYLLLPKRG